MTRVQKGDTIRAEWFEHVVEVGRGLQAEEADGV